MDNTASGSPYVGGFVGVTKGSVTLKNCVNDGSVAVAVASTSGTAYVGGFVGQMQELVFNTNDVGTLDGCVNNGKVDVTANTKYAYVGGMVGESQGGHFLNCVNDNAVTAEKSSGGNYVTVSGIVGSVSTPKKNNVSAVLSIEINGCINRGSVVGTNQAAGIVGVCGVATSQIEGCVNMGSITTTGQVVAGIAGYISVGGTHTLRACANMGSITTTTAKEVFIGGIFARGVTTINASYLYNGSADISRPNSTSGYIAGISGSGGNNPYTNCYTVNVPNHTGDGIRGYNNGYQALNDCAIVTDANMETVLATLNHEDATLTYRINTAKVQNGEDVTRIEPLYELTKEPVTMIGLQMSDVVDDAYSIRFLAAVNSLNYNGAGFTISAVVRTTDGEGNTLNLNADATDFAVTDVYTSMIANGETLVAPFGTYYIACEMVGIDAADLVEFTVVPYTVSGTTTTSGDAMVVTVCNGQVQ